MKILIVDDHPDLRDALSLLLSDAGHEIASASNGQEALDLLFRGQDLPSLIISDVDMPVMDGWRFLRVLRAYARFAELPVIMLTGSHDAARLVEPRLYQRLLTKPIRDDVLLMTVNEFAPPKTVVG